MTTLISHPLPVLALGLPLGPRLIPPRLLLAGLLFSLLPDADVLAFKFGIAYADAFGHRGFSHSLLFAGLSGVLGALAWSGSAFCARTTTSSLIEQSGIIPSKFFCAS